MINLRRLDVIRIFALSAVLLTPSAISWAQQRAEGENADHIKSAHIYHECRSSVRARKV